MTPERRRLCVFCGASAGARPAYDAAARALGATLARRGHDLVYGGANVGLMGTVADAVLAGGGRVTGVIPTALVEKEIAHRGLSDLRIVSSMHERKAAMAELSDGFIALPGGLGTLDELFEILTWAQLGLHAKPCGLLNVGGYYNPLVTFLDHAVAERFIRPAHRAVLMVESDADALLDRFLGYRPVAADKWIGRDET